MIPSQPSRHFSAAMCALKAQFNKASQSRAARAEKTLNKQSCFTPSSHIFPPANLCPATCWMCSMHNVQHLAMTGKQALNPLSVHIKMAQLGGHPLKGMIV